MTKVNSASRVAGVLAGLTRSGPCKAPDPLGVIAEEHALQLELCDILEAIADDLPRLQSRHLLDVSVSILRGIWPAHITFEEECLFPVLRRRAQDRIAERILTQLELEHEHDGDFSIDLIAALEEASLTGSVNNPQMLGYMLRGFFESQRRHILWEEATILPLARRVLTKPDLAEMQDWIMRSSYPWCKQYPQMKLKASGQPADPCRCCTLNS